MIHALYLSPRLIVARTGLPRACSAELPLLFQHFEYSPHLLVLAPFGASESWFLQDSLGFAILDPSGGACPYKLQRSTGKTCSFAPAAERFCREFPCG